MSANHHNYSPPPALDGPAFVAPQTVTPEESDRAAARVALRQAASALLSVGLSDHAAGLLEAPAEEVDARLACAILEVWNSMGQAHRRGSPPREVGPLRAALKALGAARAMQVPT